MKTNQGIKFGSGGDILLTCLLASKADTPLQSILSNAGLV